MLSCASFSLVPVKNPALCNKSTCFNANHIFCPVHAVLFNMRLIYIIYTCSSYPWNRVRPRMGSQQHHLCLYISKVRSFSISFFSPQAVPPDCGGGMAHTDRDRFCFTSRTFSAFPTVGREKHQLVWEMLSFVGQQEWSNTESYRGGCLLMGDELFHCKDHFSIIKQKTKISVSMEEKEKRQFKPYFVLWNTLCIWINIIILLSVPTSNFAEQKFVSVTTLKQLFKMQVSCWSTYNFTVPQ